MFRSIRFRFDLLAQAAVLSCAAVALSQTRPASAQAPAGNSDPSARPPITLDVPALVDMKSFKCGQLPGPASLIPFPFNIRVGGMLSPVSKLALGADLTISGAHLMPNVNTRVDGDVILGSNLGGSNTIIPVTLDQLYSKNLVGGTSIYFGPGIGMFFGGKTRFGGKLALGASVKRLGIEADLDYAGTGNPLFLLQARFGL